MDRWKAANCRTSQRGIQEQGDREVETWEFIRTQLAEIRSVAETTGKELNLLRAVLHSICVTGFDGFEDGCLLFRWDSKQAPENVKSFMTGYLDRFRVGALLKKDQSINQGSQKSNNEKQ